MTNTIKQDLVKIMERGQITIPINFRRTLNLNPGNRLWIKLTSDKTLLIEQLDQDKKQQLNTFLNDMKEDKTIYWQDKSDYLKKTKEKSQKRIKKLYE